MIIEVGETYKTRNGNRVKIKYQHIDRFYGDIRNEAGSHERVASFNVFGKYKLSGESSEFDIVGVE